MALALQIPVNSVGLTVPDIFSVANSPVTSSGTIAVSLVSQDQNLVWASPDGSNGNPSFRALVAADLPPLAYVTSVALSLPGIFSVSGSPVTSSGTLSASLVNQNSGLVFAGPSSGPASAPTFRSLVSTDIPALAYVTSVGLGLPAIFNVSGSPVTSSGTLTATLATQSSGLVFAGPSSGGPAAPTFRSLVSTDIPPLSYVTSVGLSLPGIFSVSGSPVTSSGTLAASFVNQNAAQVLAGPVSGPSSAPTFRPLVDTDIPALAYVSSVGLSSDGVVYSVSGSPVTSTGTLQLNLIHQSANTILCGPAAGGPVSPAFRALVADDIPSTLNGTSFTGACTLGAGLQLYTTTVSTNYSLV